MSQPRHVTRRQAFGAAGLGVTALALPTAIAAASPGPDSGTAEGQEVLYHPDVRFRNSLSVGPPPDQMENPEIVVIAAWAEGYTRSAQGAQDVSGTTGEEMPFSWTLVGTRADDTPLSLSGTHSTGVLLLEGNSSKIGALFTFTMTSTGTPSGDVRIFEHTR